MDNLDEHINKMFQRYWTGELVLSSLDNMKKQLKKNLTDQLNCYWSGHSAYQIMIDGDFLVDGKANTQKSLTPLGELFMAQNKNLDITLTQ
jgi:hypothetical protein